MSGDTESAAFILTRKSQLAGDMNDGIEAVQLAEAACRLAPKGSRIAAIAAADAIYGHALLGDSMAASKAYERSHKLLDSAEPDNLPWGQFLNESWIDAHWARAHGALGNFDMAAAQYESAVDNLPEEFRRDAGVYLAREAHTLAAAQDAQRATTIGMQALSIGSETSSTRIINELTEVDNLLAKTGKAPGEFSAAVREARRQNLPPSPGAAT